MSPENRKRIKISTTVDERTHAELMRLCDEWRCTLAVTLDRLLLERATKSPSKPQ